MCNIDEGINSDNVYISFYFCLFLNFKIFINDTECEIQYQSHKKPRKYIFQGSCCIQFRSEFLLLKMKLERRPARACRCFSGMHVHINSDLGPENVKKL